MKLSWRRKEYGPVSWIPDRGRERRRGRDQGKGGRGAGAEAGVWLIGRLGDMFSALGLNYLERHSQDHSNRTGIRQA